MQHYSTWNPIFTFTVYTHTALANITLGDKAAVKAPLLKPNAADPVRDLWSVTRCMSLQRRHHPRTTPAAPPFSRQSLKAEKIQVSRKERCDVVHNIIKDLESHLNW